MHKSKAHYVSVASEQCPPVTNQVFHCIAWIKKQSAPVTGQVWHCVAYLLSLSGLRNNLSLSEFVKPWRLYIFVHIEYIGLRNNLSLSQVKTCRLPSIIRAGAPLLTSTLAKINCLSQDTPKNHKSKTGKTYTNTLKSRVWDTKYNTLVKVRAPTNSGLLRINKNLDSATQPPHTPTYEDS